MKEFAVYSEDKALLRAFKEKLREKNFVSDYGEGDMLIIDYKNQLYFYKYKVWNDEYKRYTLPQQWNEAVKALEELTQPQFKVGDWVIVNEKHIGKVKYSVSRLNPNYVDVKFGEGSKSVATLKYNLRHATKEEIKEELIRRSGLKIGDEVRIDLSKWPASEEVSSDNSMRIESFKLVGKSEYSSWLCQRYANKYGLCLAVKESSTEIPADNVKKVENDFDFEIETTEGTFKPKINDGQVKVGCVSWDKSNVNFLYAFALWCEEQGIFVSINNKGEITEFRTNSGDVKQKITSEQIGEIVQKLSDK